MGEYLMRKIKSSLRTYYFIDCVIRFKKLYSCRR